MADFEMETPRLEMRRMTWADMPALKAILQDPKAMAFYDGPMDDGECGAWMQRQLDRYRDLGFGALAVVLKETGEMIGQCGLSIQQAEGEDYLEIGYLFQRAHWGHGYATEAARASKDYAFEILDAPAVYSFIREGNIASMNVAIRNGMTIRGRFVKHYRGVDMPHYMFCVKNPARP